MKKDSFDRKLAKSEAEATVRKNRSGHYFDLHQKSLVKKGIRHLTDKQLMDLFAKLRLRFTLTPQCNLWCIFCSNEGSSYTAKHQRFAEIGEVTKLSDMLLKSTPLKSIDFSGGEPMIHPDFIQKKFQLLKWTKQYPRIRFSIHTNGILLAPSVVDRLRENFSRIGISVHSFNFSTWNMITNGNNIFPKSGQQEKFKSMLKNLEYLAKQSIGEKVFLKSVIVRGVNDSEAELQSFLQKCEEYNFHPKFLEFEPQYPDQRKFIVGRQELFAKLERLGCKFSTDTPRHNDPNTYIPGVNFQYKKVPTGLHSIFGCGLKAACETCYDFLCMFVKPFENGQGLYLKPCAALETRIDLQHAMETQNAAQLLELFRLSREYLMQSPGLGVAGWKKEFQYRSEIV